MMTNLPPELIRHILSYLNDEDMYSCANTCRMWYDIAKYELLSRNSIPVFRYPDRIPSKYKAITVLGVNNITELTAECEVLEHVRLFCDATKVLSETALMVLLKKHKDHLKRLDFFYLEIEHRHVELILTYTEGLLLNIKLKKLEDISTNSIKTLIDNRELIKGFIIEYIESSRAIICYPDERTSFCIALPDVKSIVAFCPGISVFVNVGPALKHLTSLSLKSATQIVWPTLRELSHLSTLRHFYVENLNTEHIERTHLECTLAHGFTKLYSLGLVDCKQVDDSVIESIAKKKNLCNLHLDTRYTYQPKECLIMLHSLINLTNLKLLLTYSSIDIMYNIETDRKYWPKLKKHMLSFYYPCTDLPIYRLSQFGGANNTQQRLFEWWDE